MSRLTRVSHLIQQAIATILQKDIHSEKVRLVSILSVDVSPDLRNARVYYTVYGDEKSKQKTHKFLVQMRGFIKGKLGRVLHIQTVPTLSFVQQTNALI